MKKRENVPTQLTKWQPNKPKPKKKMLSAILAMITGLMKSFQQELLMLPTLLMLLSVNTSRQHIILSDSLFFISTNSLLPFSLW